MPGDGLSSTSPSSMLRSWLLVFRVGSPAWYDRRLSRGRPGERPAGHPQGPPLPPPEVSADADHVRVRELRPTVPGRRSPRPEDGQVQELRSPAADPGRGAGRACIPAPDRSGSRAGPSGRNGTNGAGRESVAGRLGTRRAAPAAAV